MPNPATAISNSQYNRSRLPADLGLGAECVQFEIRPNGYWNRRALLISVGLISFASLGIGIMFWLAGAWLILPFAGLEVLLLAGLAAAVLRNERYESLAISGDSIHVMVRCKRGCSVRSYSRHWTQARLMPDRIGTGRSRLLLVSHGRGQEIGKELIESEKYSLYRQLTSIL